MTLINDDGYFCTVFIYSWSIKLSYWILRPLKFHYSADLFWCIVSFKLSTQKIVWSYLDTQSYCCVPESMALDWRWVTWQSRIVYSQPLFVGLKVCFAPLSRIKDAAKDHVLPQKSHKLNTEQTARLYIQASTRPCQFKCSSKRAQTSQKDPVCPEPKADIQSERLTCEDGRETRGERILWPVVFRLVDILHRAACAWGAPVSRCLWMQSSKRCECEFVLESVSPVLVKAAWCSMNEEPLV